MSIIIGLYTILVGFLLYVAYSHKLFKWYTALKAACAVCFIALGAFNATLNTYSIIMLCGFVACFFGDVFLGLANNKPQYFTKLFICGICSFAFAHVLFSCAFTLFVPLSVIDLALCAISFFVTLLISKQKSFRFAKMKIPALCYSVFVGLACARGINAALWLGTYQGLLIVLGAVLFLISDALILFLYFPIKKPRKFIRVLNLLTYYIAMLFLALSI